MRVALLGAGGTIGPAIARDLAESPEVGDLVLLDLDGARAREVASRHGAGRAQGAAVDAGDRQALTLALEGCAVLVNASSYRLNLHAMDACLAAGCSYIDLGGLYRMTKRQLELGPAFEERGLLALLGAGAGPGKTNVMAARAAAGLDSVDEVRCASAGLDLDPPPGLSTPYALRTLLDEVTVPPVVVRDDEAEEIEALTDGGRIAFPEPIGERDSIYTLHSEVLTLPGSLRAAACDFRLSLGPGILDALRELATRSEEEIAAVRPAPPSPRTHSAQHVVVRGTRGGEPAAVTVTAHTAPHEAWGLGGGIVSTASVAAASVRMLARGQLKGAAMPGMPPAGALPPERVLDFDVLAAELEPRGCTFTVKEEQLV
jgi:saccharopine dehydrogenase-like NADP-dependent oxidoreductase